MSKNSGPAIHTKYGVLKVGDIAVITTQIDGNRETAIIFVAELYDNGPEEQYICFYTFCPATKKATRDVLSWEEFRNSTTKLDIFGMLSGVRHWENFLNYYIYHQLVQKAESLLPYHIAAA